MSMTIKTNHHRYEVLCWHELPEKFQKEMDYVSEEEKCDPRFVIYKRWVYDLGEFMTTAPGPFTCLPEGHPFLEWDGYASDSFFSGVLCRYPDSYSADWVQMGTYYS